MAEPNVVVTNREHLWWLLAEAAQLEHMIMCQYLYAEFSLKDGVADGLTPEQADAVGRWRTVLRGIAVEEMLHLTLVANLMSAIGAAPTVHRPNFPQRSAYFPAGVQLDLLPFGGPALQHFLYLERPEGLERQDAEGFIPSALPRAPLQPTELMPRGQEFLTVGHLYRGIAEGLRTLAARYGEAGLFVGSPRAQATPQLLGWSKVVAVTDLASALAAVEEIIEQGEGARGNWRDAHYGRFLAIWDEYHELRGRDPSFEPARPVRAAYTSQPFDQTIPVEVIADPLTQHVAELAELGYEMVLQILLRFFTHTDETDQQLRVLTDGAMTLMAGVLRPLAVALTELPIAQGQVGGTAGFTFQMHYIMGNMVPWREAAWALLHERLALLVDRCAVTTTDRPELGDALRRAADAAATVSAALAAHVPERLLTAE